MGAFHVKHALASGNGGGQAERSRGRASQAGFNWLITTSNGLEPDLYETSSRSLPSPRAKRARGETDRHLNPEEFGITGPSNPGDFRLPACRPATMVPHTAQPNEGKAQDPEKEEQNASETRQAVEPPLTHRVKVPD